MKILVQFQEKPVIDAASKFVLENLRHVGDSDFIKNLVRLCMDEVRKTLDVSVVEDKLNVFGE